MIEYLSKINELMYNLLIALLWVPGHFGIEGNERTVGSQSAFTAPEPVTGLSYLLKNNHQKHLFWATSTTCGHTKDIITCPNKKNAEYLLNCGLKII